MTPAAFEQWLLSPHRDPLVMGILNVTPDSFSDGGDYIDPARAIARAHEMLAEGAAILDLGAESTRPGSMPTPEAEQLRRLLPVVQGLRDSGALLSVDTTRASVAAAALGAGTHLVNDISAGRDDPDMLPLLAARGAPVILMHVQGTPATMQLNPRYDDVTREVKSFLLDRAQAAQAAGIPPHRILLDPGYGFGKTLDHNIQLLRDLRTLTALPHPIVVGTSRKGFLGKLTNQPDATKRLHATTATTAWAVANGAAVVRVHDVGPNRDAVGVIRALT